MIGLRLRVPIAAFRRGHAREFAETERFPPPATCYGALLSYVGETERERHRGVRIGVGMLSKPKVSTVLRTRWQIKDTSKPQGSGQNAGPDYQQLLVGLDIVVWCDSADENEQPHLEARVSEAFRNPSLVGRFGGWSLGESTHLIDDVLLVDEPHLLGPVDTLLLDQEGDVTTPVWVDHVGMSGTHYVVGKFEAILGYPPRERLPMIPLHTERPKRAARRS